MFARNFKNPRAAEPELDEKSLAFLGISYTSACGPPSIVRPIFACAV
jgi:hypothetical protein